MGRSPRWALAVAAHLLALTPLAWIVWDGMHGQLTFNPIRELTLRTGKAALVILMLSLAAAPAARVLNLAPVSGLRRAWGLYAFGYACLHALTFVGLDYRFDLGSLLLEVSQKRYIVAGAAAFLCLVPLAVTSTKGWKARLGRTWTSLHRLAYIAAVLAAIHFLWQAKGDLREPVPFGVALLILLAARAAWWLQTRAGRQLPPGPPQS